MKLYNVTYYSIDEGVLIPERSWIVEVPEENENDILSKCVEYSKKVSNGLFMAQLIYTVPYEDFTEEFVLDELKNL